MHGTEAVDAVGTPSAAEMRLQRNLKIVVILLAVLLLVGLATVVGRIIYLASGHRTQPAATGGALRPELSMQLPAGAVVRSIALSGDRLAVHYDAAGAEGIAIIDLRTGERLVAVGLQRLSPAK